LKAGSRAEPTGDAAIKHIRTRFSAIWHEHARHARRPTAPPV